MKKCIAFVGLIVSASVSAQPVFKTDIAPILDKHCTSCHSGWFPDAGVDLGDLKSIREGSKAGPLVVPGKPDKGWLMFVITKASGKQRMPPVGPRLSEQEINTLRAWIEAGAN